MAAKKTTKAETLKTTEAVKAAAPVKETKAEPAKSVKPEAIATKKDATKAIETKKDATKAIETRAAVLKEPVKAAPKKAPVKRTTAKPAAAKPAAARRAVKTDVKTEYFLQFAGNEYSDKEIFQKVKDVWTKELKRKVGDMKSVQIYLKPEEAAAYYVINEDATGKVDL